MLASTRDLQPCELDGRTYWFRSLGVYDTAKMRRQLRKQGVRRPDKVELRVCAQLGVRKLAEAGDWPEGEGDRLSDLIGTWYELLEPIDENAIDEVDGEKRAAILAERELTRQTEMSRLLPEVWDVEATLERHWPAYAALVADQGYWDEVTAIDATRLMLVRIDEAQAPKDDDGFLPEPAYLAIPPEHRARLGQMAVSLLAPTETQRKN